MLRILGMLLLTCAFAGADTIREALVNLCDPAKIGAITANQNANSRVLQICYWLEMARRDGRDPAVEMRKVMVAVGWGVTEVTDLPVNLDGRPLAAPQVRPVKNMSSTSTKGDLTCAAMVSNWAIVENHGCLDEAGMVDLRQGNSPTIRIGRDAGDKLSVYHLIPLSVCPELDTALANLRLGPMQSYHYRSNPMGGNEVYWVKEFYAAGLLSDEGALRLLPSLETAVGREGERGGWCATKGVQARGYLNSIKEELRRRGAL
jgi:hypothetical protein